jgi:hypothetical protein
VAEAEVAKEAVRKEAADADFESAGRADEDSVSTASVAVIVVLVVCAADGGKCKADGEEPRWWWFC